MHTTQPHIRQIIQLPVKDHVGDIANNPMLLEVTDARDRRIPCQINR